MSQDSGDREAAERLTKEFNELNGTLRLLLAERNGQNTATQTTNINAGGWGIIIALLMVAFVTGMNIRNSANESTRAVELLKQTSDINEIRRKQDRDDDYVMSIFRMVPEIKQKIDAEKAKEKVN